MPFEYGYSGTQLSLKQLMTKGTVFRLHPEFRRRVFAAMLWAADQGINVGIGTGWRSPSQQANTSGGASVWNSWHEGESVSNDVNALAVDTVPTSAQHWFVADPQRLKQFGLIAFITSTNPAYWNTQNRSYQGKQEYWHWQPYEIGYGRGYYKGGIKLPKWPIPAQYDVDVVGLEGGLPPVDPIPGPTQDPPPPPPVVAPPPVVVTPPPVTEKAITVSFESRYLKVGVADGPDVAKFQRILNEVAGQGLTIDGNYGNKTAAAVTNWQKFFGLAVDGEAGPATQSSMVAIWLKV